MRTFLAVLGAMLLMSVSAIGAMAQDATPAAGAATAATSVDPAIGETVTYVDVSGNPVATVTVESVVNRGSVEVSDFDFTMQDAAGFLWGTTFAEAAEGAEITTLQDDLALVSGDSATFLVVFEVLQDQPLAHLFWQPDSGRLITLASLDGV